MPKLSPIDIGKRIKEARIEKRIEVPFIAEKTGLNKSTIYRYENGDVKRVKRPIVEAIANIVGVNPLWLTGESDDKEEIFPGLRARTREDYCCFKNLSFIRRKKGLTQLGMAHELDLSLDYYKRLESGDDVLSLEAAAPIAGKLGVDTFDLLFEDITSIKYKKHIDNILNKHKMITVYGKVCAGDGREVFEEPIDEIINPYPRIKNKLFALQVHGDSMNNVVNDGMYALILKTEVVDSGDIAVILIDNEIGMLKRFYKIDDSTILLKPESSNEIHKTMVFENEDINRLKILGRYVGHVSPMVDF